MKVLIKSKMGRLLDLALRLSVDKDNGAEIYFQSDNKEAGQGFNDLQVCRETKSKFDFIIEDKKENLELSCIKEDDVIKVVKKLSFLKKEDALNYAKENKGVYYIKQGGFRNFSRFENGIDAIEIIRNFSENEEIILSPRKFGVSLGILGFFNGSDFVVPLLVCFLQNRLLTKNFGSPCDSTGAVGLWAGTQSIFNKTASKLVDGLREKKYKGLVYCKVIASEENIFITSVDLGFPVPEIYLLPEIMRTPLFRLLVEVEDYKEIEIYQHAGTVISVFLPNFPYDFCSYYKNIPLFGYGEQTKQHIHLNEVRKDKDNNVKCMGTSPYSVSAFGKMPKHSINLVYQFLRNVYVPNSFFRMDIGQFWFKNKELLSKWGLI